MSTKLYNKAIFYFSKKVNGKIISFFRKTLLRIKGSQIGINTNIPKFFITWPHQLSIGNNCILERGIYFKYDGIWQEGPNIIIGDNVFIGRNCEFNITLRITIHKDCLIASGCKFIDHDHQIQLYEPIGGRAGEEEITIDENVWLGFNVIVLKGVHIEKGAVVAAGSVVTKDIPSNEIWGGIPAKKIGLRK